MTYRYTITDDDRDDLMDWLCSQGFDGKPGPANWLRAMVSDWAVATNQPYRDEEGIPYGYDEYERMAYDSMISHSICDHCGATQVSFNEDGSRYCHQCWRSS